MLYPPEQVIDKMFAIDVPTFITIDSEQSRLTEYESKILTQFCKKVHCFTLISKTLSFVKKLSSQKNYHYQSSLKSQKHQNLHCGLQREYLWTH